MSDFVSIVRQGEEAAEIRNAAGGLLLRYVVRPGTPGDESSRPYAHPVCSMAGELLTNFRPNDHRWHHGLSFTVGSVAGWNFWGGPTYRREGGYQWRGDHGVQRHIAWRDGEPGQLAHALEWRGGEEVLMTEERVLTATIESPQQWTLRWQGALRNCTARELSLGNYHSREGLAGSHYTGLQFRGARDLLDRHGDAEIGVRNETGANGAAAVHGVPARWMEWRGQKDTSLRRVNLRFENAAGPLYWFVREENPLAAFSFQSDQDLRLAPGATLEIDHRLTFTDA